MYLIFRYENESYNDIEEQVEIEPENTNDIIKTIKTKPVKRLLEVSDESDYSENNTDTKYVDQIISESKENKEAEFIKSNYENYLLNVLQNTYPNSDNSPTDSEFERLVNEIRSGNDVLIFTPVSDSNPDNNIALEVTKESTTESTNVMPENVPQLPKKPCVIIVTKRLEENDPIPALPVWTKIKFSDVDYPIKRKRLDQLFNSDYVKNVNQSPYKNQ